MPDFDAAAPPKTVTDPDQVGRLEYPRHVYKAATAPKEGEEPIGLIVAWDGKTPIYNEFQEVADVAAFNAALAEGWAADPVVPKPTAKADDKAPKGKK